MAYTPSQRKVIRRIKRIGRRRGESRVKIKSALETGRVESNYQNLPGGDADSQGWRQERSSLYANPRNLKASINRYYNEADQLYHGQSAGDLAADVQRPRAEFRGRYAEHSSEASALLRGGAGGRGGAAGGSTTAGGRRVKLPSTTITNPGVDNSVARKQALLSYFTSGQRHQPGGLVALAGTLQGLKDTPGSTETIGGGTVQTGFGGAQTGAKTVRSVSTSPKVGRAIGAAKSYLGVAETNGSNTGPGVDRIEARFDAHAAAWCGYFAGTVLQKAGVKGVGSWIGSTAAIQQKAQAGQGPFSGFSQGTGRAKAGDLLLVREGGPSGHVEVITKVDRDGTVHTIGGNVGNAVRRQTHAPGSAFGVAHVKYRK